MNKIVEIFESIQSEGTHAGRAAIFVRFYGCNLACKFDETHSCDEPLHTMKDMVTEFTDDELIKLVGSKAQKLVVITGGEPSLHNLNNLISGMQRVGKYVAVETNGTNFHNIATADWITYSPKFMWDSNAPKMQFGFHELKLLAGPNAVPDEKAWSSINNKYIQPIAIGEEVDMENMEWCHDWVTNHPEWKLSLQYHKLLGKD